MHIHMHRLYTYFAVAVRFCWALSEHDFRGSARLKMRASVDANTRKKLLPLDRAKEARFRLLPSRPRQKTNIEHKNNRMGGQSI